MILTYLGKDLASRTRSPSRASHYTTVPFSLASGVIIRLWAIVRTEPWIRRPQELRRLCISSRLRSPRITSSEYSIGRPPPGPSDSS